MAQVSSRSARPLQPYVGADVGAGVGTPGGYVMVGPIVGLVGTAVGLEVQNSGQVPGQLNARSDSHIFDA
jgi:uncharacterized membrane protein